MRIFSKKSLIEIVIRFPGLGNLFLKLVLSRKFPRVLGSKFAIISRKHRLIYIFIPKVACSSLKKSLFPLFDLENNLDPHAVRFPKIPVWEIIPQKEHFTFAFVRNPWDRLVSCYKDKIRYYYPSNDKRVNGVYKQFLKLYGNRFYAEMTFTDFAMVVCGIPDSVSDLHFRSQHCSLVHNGKLLPNFIGRFENLEKDFHEICRINGLSLELPHMFGNTAREKLGKAWVKTDYRSYYTRELEEMVGKRYSRDIDLFGYTFD